MFLKVLQSKTRLFLLGTCALWVAGIGVGFARLMDYATTAGDPGPAAGHWPAGTMLTLDPDRPTLVLAAHPRCPCTSATMDELENLIAHCRGLVALQVLFYRPSAAPDDWAQTDLWRRAAAIPGAAVHADADGVQARLFGATTSGHALLYQPDGSLLFSGGITNTRGHAGPSSGADALRSLLTKGTAPQAETPVYGCPLTGPRAPDRKGDQPCRQ